MHVNKADIVISAVSEKQYPELNLPEIVLLGRSNVGKSSFINALINRKGLARTSSQPGKTQTMNFYEIGTKEEDFLFVDMPGYGYAKVSKKERLKWGAMIEDYLRNRPNIACVFLLVDSRVGPTEDDHLMFDWLCHYDLSPVVIMTKCDKISKNAAQKMRAQVASEFGMHDKNGVVIFSAQAKTGVEEVWQMIVNHLETAKRVGHQESPVL